MATSISLAGVTGMIAHRRMLEVVGDNLANLSSTAFKGSRVTFSDVFANTMSRGTSPNASIGGTNPRQVGAGTQISSIDKDMSQGTLQATGRDLDLAIQGEGYFVVTDGAQDFYTRAGTFDLDEDFGLVHTGTGMRVRAASGEPIQIPIDAGVPAKATTQVTLAGNLSADARPPATEVLRASLPFTAGGTPATLSTDLNALDDNVVDYVPGDIITVAGRDVDSSVVTGDFVYGTGAGQNGTTVGDLINFINSLYTGATASLDANGELVLTANAEGNADLALTVTDAIGNTGSTRFSDHAMFLETDGYDGDVVDSSIEIFDSLGRAHALKLQFRRSLTGWDLDASIPPEDGTIIDGAVQGLTFNPDGSFSLVAGSGTGDPLIRFQFDGLTEPQVISFDFGTPGDFDGLTFFGGLSSATATDQDGFEAGSLASLSVTPEGIIQGFYTNGLRQDLAQLQIASFANPAGLERVSDSLFTASPNSGKAVVGTAGAGRNGTVVAGALEGSNVDVAIEFTRLISAQYGFQVNARSITTTSDTLQELVNILR
ncbi:MAG: flagellar hook-basal body complex protein [Planctomycetota bacterium]|nr:MAG: flagellar hook-basal body complex protein [Planctomycetota bacterium]